MSDKFDSSLNSMTDREILRELQSSGEGFDRKVKPRDIRKALQDSEVPWNYNVKPRSKRELKQVIADRLDTSGDSGRYS